MSYLVKELNIKVNFDAVYSSTLHKYHVITQSIINQSDELKYYNLIPAVNPLQYQVGVYSIHIERLLNARWKLTYLNMDGEEAVLKLIITFFYE